MKRFYNSLNVPGGLNVLKILMVISMLLITKQSLTQTIDFEEITAVNNTNLGTVYTSGNFRFTLTGADWVASDAEGNGGSKGLRPNSTESESTLTIETIDGTEFHFENFYRSADPLGIFSIGKIEGFKNGLSTGESASHSSTGVFTMGDALDDVDKVVFSESTFLVVTFDDFVFSTALASANVAPVVTAPTAPSVTEDDMNVAIPDDIEIQEADTEDDATLTFTITGGTLTLGTSGITFGGNNNGTASFTAQGSISDLNTSLDAATFTPVPDLDGTDVATISFIANDGTANSNTASVTFDINGVNDVPGFSSSAITAPSQDNSYQYTINTTDKDEDAIVITGTTLPDWLQLGTADDVEYRVGTLAGGGEAGNTDGNAESARFSGPSSVAVNSHGIVYVADRSNSKIRKIGADGTVSTLAGSGTSGYQDGTGTDARFTNLNSIVLDADGNLFVTDQYRIRKVTPEGVTTTFAGSGSQEHVDGTGTAASFWHMRDITIDGSGNFYVISGNGIRKITSAGVVTTFAGLYNQQGAANGTGTNATFSQPGGIDADASGNLYVADGANYLIRKISPEGVVTTFAGSGSSGTTDGTGTAASFRQLSGIDIASDGNIYTTSFSGLIRKVTTAGVVTTIAGSGTEENGIGTNAKLYQPQGLDVDSQGNIYLADHNVVSTDPHLIRKISPVSFVLSGDASGVSGDHSVTLKADDNKGGTANQSFTINADPQIFFNATTSEGAESESSTNIQVNLSKASTEEVTVSYAVTGTATGGGVDYTLANGTLTIDAAQTSANISISNIIDDTENETNETVIVTLSSPSGAVLGTNTVHTYTINDNDITTANAGADQSNCGPTLISTLLAGNAVNAATGETGEWTIVSGNGGNIQTASSPTSLFSGIFGVPYTLRWTIFKGGALSSTDDVLVTFSSSVTAAAAGSDQQVEKSATLAANAVATGETGTWSEVTGDGKGSFGDVNSHTSSFSGTRGITYTLRWTIGNGSCTDSTDDVVIEIEPNSTPAFTSTATTAVDDNESYSYAITTSDADEDDITVTATTKPDWLSLDIGSYTTSFAGNGTSGVVDGPVANAQFSGGKGMVFDDEGNLYLVEEGSSVLRKISISGVVTTVAGDGTQGYQDGIGTAAKFYFPKGIDIGSDGMIYISELSNSRVRKYNPTTGEVTSITGNGTHGYADGDASSAQFSSMYDVAVDGDNIYVADARNYRIRKIDLTTSIVSTLAGSGVAGFADGVGTAARFNFFTAVEMGPDGYLYVADNSNHRIRKINVTTGEVTTFAGSGTAGSTDGVGTAANLNYPSELTFDKSGNLYLIEELTRSIRKITPAGVVSTYAGSLTESGYVDGAGTESRFGYPFGIATSPSGDLYVNDLTNYRIRKIQYLPLLSGDASGQSGNHNVTLKADDGEGGTVTQTFSITVSDVTAPAFENSTPSTASVTVNSFTLNTDINEAGYIYYVIVPDEATAPSAAEVKAGTASGGAATIASDFAAALSGDFNHSFNITGLSEATNYDVYVLAEDDESTPNLQTDPVKVEVTTLNAAPVFTSGTSANFTENGTGTAYTAVASDGSAITYSLGTGNDESLFNINGTSGAVTFQSSPDFESPADGDANNTYVINVVASDGINSVNQDVTITVTNVDDTPPVFTSETTASFYENSYGIAYTVTATDANTITYSLGTCFDESLFNIVGNEVEFKVIPDFENPQDVDGNNQYVITVIANDGTNSVEQTITITVLDIDEIAPVFTSATAVDFAENGTGTAYTVTAADANDLIYGLSEGNDEALFDINSTTGIVTFKTSPDFESPADGNTDNAYVIKVIASDGVNAVNQEVIITVTDVDDTDPVFTSATTVDFVENGTGTAYTIAATDVNTLTYSMGSGNDELLFNLDGTSGVVTFKASPDFENPADGDANNTYVINVVASDGINSVNQDVTITVTNVDDTDPVFTSATAVDFAENGTGTAYTVAATDANTLTYSLGTGNDEALFDIAAGAVTFKTTPDFENPVDSDANNTYVINVIASDGINSVNQDVTITVTNVDDTDPVFTSTTVIDFAENGTGTAYTVVATDANALTYSLGSGNDETLFMIEGSTGAVTFKSAPDFENPADGDANNTYVINVIASDGINSVNQDVTITVTNVDDTDPVFTSATAVDFTENGIGTAYTIVATDANALTYSLGSGNDEALFDVVGTSGAVTFKASPDFENPTDANTDNAYVINVIASDGINSVNQDVTITVTNVDDTDPVFTSAIAVDFVENGTGTAYTIVATDANALTYSLSSDNDEALFDVDGTSGVVTFKASPDFENPADGDANNTYVINIIASDGINSVNQDVTITVTNVDDTDPVFTSATTASFAENGTSTAYTIVATDATALTYSLGSGNDETLFDVDGTSGVVTFKTAPDYENPADGDANNTYVINVIASDGINSANQDVTITVTNVDDTDPVFTSATSVDFAENGTGTAYTIVATDVNALTYSLGSGNDETLFDVDGTSGVVTFKASPDFENPADANTDNAYVINVIASDGINSVNQDVTITVTNVDDTDPVFTSATAVDFAENGTGTAYMIVATDANALTYSLGSGNDEALFDVDGTSGVVTFKASPDFENPADGDANNTYVINVIASDGVNSVNQDVTITVTNVDDTDPVFTSATAVGFVENGTGTAYTAIATDANALTYSLGSQKDETLFNMDQNSGVVTFKTAPDFENPADGDANNAYVINVIASDGINSVNQDVTITITDADEIAPTVDISSQTSEITSGVFTVTVAYSETVTGFAVGDITVTNGTAGNFTSIIAGKEWTADITPASDGAVTINIAAATATDAAGNENAAATEFSIQNDETAPGVTLSAGALSGGAYTVTAQFSETVSGFTQGDITISGGTISDFTVVDGDTYTFSVSSENPSATVDITTGVATDAAGNENTAASQLSLVFNSSPTDIILSNASIDENNEVGATIGDFSTNDPDASDTHTYTLVAGAGDTDNSSFTIDGVSLKAVGTFDFETQSSYSIRVKTDDGRGGSFEKNFTISIDNVAEPEVVVSGTVDFPETQLGITVSTTITISNIGEAPVEVIASSAPSDFSVTPGSVILMAGESRQVNVNFTPTQEATYSGSLVFTYNGRQATLPVSGIGAIVTGIDDELIDENEIRLYPNPASDVVNIDLSQVHAQALDITFVNAAGKVVNTWNDYRQKQLSVRVSDLDNGLYIMQFTDGKSVVRKKVIIRK